MTVQKAALAILNDLIFTAKIQDAAKRAQMKLILATTAADALRNAKVKPSVIVLDLNMHGLDTLQLIRTLKGEAATSGIRLVGFVSHVQTTVREAALKAGCDQVVARSAFSQNLPAILSGDAENEAETSSLD
jgi:CheY-like chemotaxis protein